MARETINGISVPIPGTGEPADFQGELRGFATDLAAALALGIDEADIPGQVQAGIADSEAIQDAVAAAAAPAVSDALADLDVVTASSSEAAEPTLPTLAPDVDALYFLDDVGNLAFTIDEPGTDRARVRHGAVLYPSGDTTGATDKAAVNAALIAHDRVVLKPGDWYQNGAFVIPTETHLHIEGPFHSTLVASANSNLITNDISSTACTDIAVTAEGSVVFDGNGVNQTRNTSAGWNSVGFHFVNVDGLLVEGVEIRNTAMFGGLCVGVRHALIKDVRVEQDKLVPNQDGWDVGPACYDLHIVGLTGTTEDDVHSIFAKYSTSQNTVHPLYDTGGALYSAAGNDTHDIHISGSHVDAGKNFLRLQAAEGSKLYNIHATDLRHTGAVACRSAVILGEMLAAYIDSPPATDGSDFHDITVDGFVGKVLSLIYLDAHAKDITIRGAHLPSWNWLVSQRDTTDTAAQVKRLVIDGVTSGATASADIGNLVTLTGGMVLTDAALRNIDVAAIKRVLANTSSTVANVEIDALVGSITSGAFFASAPVENTAARLDVRSRTAVVDWGTAPTIGSAVDRYSLEGA